MLTLIFSPILLRAKEKKKQKRKGDFYINLSLKYRQFSPSTAKGNLHFYHPGQYSRQVYSLVILEIKLKRKANSRGEKKTGEKKVWTQSTARLTVNTKRSVLIAVSVPWQFAWLLRTIRLERSARVSISFRS